MTAIIWMVIGTTIGLGSPWIIKHRHRLLAELTRGSTVSTRHRSAKLSNHRSTKISKKAGSYQSVTIRPCLEACAAASEQQGHRYLAVEAPELPLAGCDTRKCACRYQHHEDRRENEDRRFKLDQFNAINSRFGTKERRPTDGSNRRKGTEKAKSPAYFNDY